MSESQLWRCDRCKTTKEGPRPADWVDIRYRDRYAAVESHLCTTCAVEFYEFMKSMPEKKP